MTDARTNKALDLFASASKWAFDAVTGKTAGKIVHVKLVWGRSIIASDRKGMVRAIRHHAKRYFGANIDHDSNANVCVLAVSPTNPSTQLIQHLKLKIGAFRHHHPRIKYVFLVFYYIGKVQGKLAGQMEMSDIARAIGDGVTSVHEVRRIGNRTNGVADLVDDIMEHQGLLM